GKPLPPDISEPENLARTIAAMRLKYVVITSVDRDDLRDGGARHFVDCIRAVRQHSPDIRIEVLVPDFRGRLETALEILAEAPPAGGFQGAFPGHSHQIRASAGSGRNRRGDPAGDAGSAQSQCGYADAGPVPAAQHPSFAGCPFCRAAAV